MLKMQHKKKEIGDFGENLFSQQYRIDSKDGIMTCLTSYLELILSAIKAIIQVLFHQNNRKVSIVVSIKTWIVKESQEWYQY